MRSLKIAGHPWDVFTKCLPLGDIRIWIVGRPTRQGPIASGRVPEGERLKQ